MVAGAFILTYGLLGMHWWEDSVFHASWNRFIFTIAQNLAEQPGHPIAEGVFEASSAVGWWTLVLLIFVPLIWYKMKHGVGRKVFWIISALLLTLGIAASMGMIEVEHGHGIDVGQNASKERE